jgi:hypothetical protein
MLITVDTLPLNTALAPAQAPATAPPAMNEVADYASAARPVSIIDSAKAADLVLTESEVDRLTRS